MTTINSATPALEEVTGDITSPPVAASLNEPVASSDQPLSTPTSAEAVFATDIICGVLMWCAPKRDYDGCLAIAILRDDEDGSADANGRKPLTGVKLIKDVSTRFEEALGNTIFKHQTHMEITIRTEDLVADIAVGRGRKGTGKPYFIGQNINYTP